MILLITILGLVFGSFANAYIYRWPREIPWVNQRSFCPTCKHQLSWYDNIPLLSFIQLRGKCRYCHHPISWSYPLIELSLATLWLTIALAANQQIALTAIGMLDLLPTGLYVTIGLLILSLASLIIIKIDLQHMLIPDQMNILLIIAAILILFATPSMLSSHIIASLSLIFFFACIYLLTRGRGIGLGDVKLAFTIGLLLGYWGWMAVLLSFWLGAAVGLTLIATKKATRKTAIPFGPYMILGLWITIIFGQVILDWYNSLSLFY